MSGLEHNDLEVLFAEGETLAEGKYKITRLLGAGGMGQVYQARHTLLDRQVAIKVLHPQVTKEPTVEARFRREAKATSMLDHRNIMQVMDFGAETRPEGEKLLYIVMEFINGQELSTILAEMSPLDLDRIISLTTQVCAALHVAHDNGIIHRDLKPENIMIVPHTDDDGLETERVKVCDFGIAKLQSSGEYDSGPSTKLTEMGAIFGTPHYMSPEQARGKRLDARSDVYALGVVLFELATGQVPFAGENLMGVLAQHLGDPPPLATDILEDVDPRLEQVISRCLEKDPTERYQSARDLRTALLGIADSAHVSIVVNDSEETATSKKRLIGLESARTIDAQSGAGQSPQGQAATEPIRLSEPTKENTPRRKGALVWVLLLLVGALATTFWFVYFSGEQEADGANPIISKTEERQEPDPPESTEMDSATNAPVTVDAGQSSTDVPSTPPSSPKSTRKKRKKKPAAAKPEDAPNDVALTEPENEEAVEAPETESEPPEEEPPPTPVPTVEPPPSQPDPVQEPPSLDATVSADLIDVQGSLSKSPIRRGVKRVMDGYKACYREAAKKAGKDWAGKIDVRFRIDVDGQARGAKASAGGLGGLSSCVERTTSTVRSSVRPDTGEVHVKMAVRFKPL